MPSHALSSRPETQARRLDRRVRRRQESIRRLRDWRTWAVSLAGAVDFGLSGALPDYFWPKAHGAAYILTHVVVRGILAAVIAAVLVAIYASIARYRRRQPRLPAIRAARPADAYEDARASLRMSRRVILVCRIRAHSAGAVPGPLDRRQPPFR